MWAQEVQSKSDFFSSMERPAYAFFCEQGLKSDFLLLSIPPSTYLLSQEAGKLEEAFYNLVRVTEVVGTG